MKIRKYKPEDHDRIDEICIETAREGLKTTPEMVEALTIVFSHYYTEQEPENVFVAVDDEDTAQGYILCADDFGIWSEEFQERYLNDSQNLPARMMGFGSVEALEPYADEYPAHLHIDLMPSIQGQGVGTQLITALVEHLKAKKIRGLILDVAADNERAIRFYKKNGFQVLHDDGDGIVMGMQLG